MQNDYNIIIKNVITRKESSNNGDKEEISNKISEITTRKTSHEKPKRKHLKKEIKPIEKTLKQKCLKSVKYYIKSFLIKLILFFLMTYIIVFSFKISEIVYNKFIDKEYYPCQNYLPDILNNTLTDGLSMIMPCSNMEISYYSEISYAIKNLS